MQRYGQKSSKIPRKWSFSQICDPPKIFFKNRALSLLYPYGALTSCKKLEKTNQRSLRYLKTDTHTDGRTHWHGRLLRTPSGKPRLQNSLIMPIFKQLFMQKSRPEYPQQMIFFQIFSWIKILLPQFLWRSVLMKKCKIFKAVLVRAETDRQTIINQ